MPIHTACTLSIAFVTGLSYLLSLMFSVQNWESLKESQTGLPLAEIFRQATQSRGGAFALVFILWVALGPCMLGSQLSESSTQDRPTTSSLITISAGTGRMVWAFARDDGLPFSKM